MKQKSWGKKELFVKKVQSKNKLLIKALPKLNKMKNKKAVFFSTDALVALFIILLTISVAYPVLKYAKYDSGIQGDVLNVFSTLRISEIDNDYVKNLTSEGKILNQNNTLLEQIGEFYVTNITEARLLAEEILDELTINENIGIWYGGSLIAAVNNTPIETAKNIQAERQMISGIQEGESVTGFSGRAYLSSSYHTKYFYFGGYVGDGNLSAIINYTGTINSSEMELVINKNFDVYVNIISSGSYSASPSELIPQKYNLSIDNFNSGLNTIEFRGDNLYIAGGYIKILYENSVEFTENEKYSFPGIEGAVNLYDGFYVPENLNEMDLSLHINNNYSFFMNLGNVTVYNGSTNGEETISIDNSVLSLLLDYDEIEGKTIPLRIGFENVSYVSQIGGNADVFSVTDLSGSMAPDCSGSSPFYCCWFNDCSSASGCSSCGGTLTDNKIQEAKDANYVFIDSVLNLSGNRAGLVGYASDAPDSDYHELSNDNASLKSQVDDWDAIGGTCICCGINKATESLVADSSADKYQSMIVMSDGGANVRCDDDQGTGSASGDAIQAACDAYENYGIIVYAVGFGSDAVESTLQSIATCGNGSYFYSDVSELAAIYQQIAEDIINAAYNEQTIEISGDIYTKLYPDSYIEFDYNKSTLPYGLVMTSEKQFDNDSSGIFEIPTGAMVVDANVISYSGARWTDYSEINNTEFYNLSKYGENYIQLGDPYSVNIPNSLIQSSNLVTVSTGLAPENSSSGSQYNKIIYSILQNVTAYSQITSSAEGCVWTINFDDGTSSSLTIPTTYSGANTCSYAPGNIVYNENDALQNSVYNLLIQLDFDSDGQLDVKISEQNLEISSNEITGIPFTWSTEVQIRKWY